MKKLFTLLCLCLPLLVRAQEELYKKVAQETCDCITKKDLTSATKSSVETALGLCMLESIQKNGIEVDMTDNAAMRSFGEKVGLQMAPLCPSVFSILTEASTQKEMPAAEVVTVSGKIKTIDENEFLFVTVKEESGRETRMIWLRHVKGFDDYLTNPRQLMGKKVVIKYSPIDCYLPKAKGYFAYKEIIELEVQ